VIRGIDRFRESFESFSDYYVIIGGTACDAIMDEAGIDFRATKDIDIVLLIEEINADFAKRIWDFIKAGNYQNIEKSIESKQYYRFMKPDKDDFPYMIELFTRKPDLMQKSIDSKFTPLHFGNYISSLSAILLDEDYYNLLKSNKIVIEGISVAGTESLILLKAKAFIDLSKRKEEGDPIDSKDIKKHRNDVLRLSQLLSQDQRISITHKLKSDFEEFIDAELSDDNYIDLKQLGIKNVTLKDVISRLKITFGIE
jgi:hypothetical protein